MKRSIVKLLGLVKSVTKMVTGCLRTTKVPIFVAKDLKGLLAKYEKCKTVSLTPYYLLSTPPPSCKVSFLNVPLTPFLFISVLVKRRSLSRRRLNENVNVASPRRELECYRLPTLQDTTAAAMITNTTGI